jgi:DNA-binding MarR family transcriptional regulator
VQEAKEPSEEMALLVADILEAAGALRRSGERIARQVGQTQSRWQTLSAASAPGQTVPAIARRLGVTRQAVQPVVNDLARDQLVRLVPNPTHRRSPFVALTASGHRMLTVLTETASAANRELVDRIGMSDVTLTRRTLSKLVAAVMDQQRDDGRQKGESAHVRAH